MTDDDDITMPQWRCKACGERFPDAIKMPRRFHAEPGQDPVMIPASNHCPFCRSEKLERWK